MLRRAGAGLVLLAWSGALGCAPPVGPVSASDLRPASLGAPATAALVVGCWSLTWRLDAAGSSAAEGELPDSVRLRDEVVFGTRERLVTPATHPSGRLAARGERPWESRFVLNRWWIENEALRVRFSNGEDDTWQVGLGVDSDGLSGRARYDGNQAAGEARLAADVSATRIECEYE